MGWKKGWTEFMRNKQFKVLAFITSLVLALGVFLGSYAFYKKFEVEQPLLEQLSAMPSVEQVSMEKEKGEYVFDIKLKKVDNIQEEYEKINQVINSKLEKETYDIKIQDDGNRKLQEFSDQLQPAVYEALAHNRYVWLEEEIAEKSAENQLNYRIFVDEKHLYLQLEDGSKYIYKIFNRDTESLTAG